MVNCEYRADTPDSPSLCLLCEFLILKYLLPITRNAPVKTEGCPWDMLQLRSYRQRLMGETLHLV